MVPSGKIGLGFLVINGEIFGSGMPEARQLGDQRVMVVNCYPTHLCFSNAVLQAPLT